MAETLSIQSPAKLNLALSVGRPREDGMHPIASWMTTISLGDELTLTRLEPDRMSRYAILWHDEARRPTEIDWAIRDDLAVRAHLALEGLVGRRLPLQMKLHKRIPVGGGLGGGSSNAAAMLRGVNQIFDLGIPSEKLLAVARTLGADVSFFIRGGSAIVEGFGELVEHYETDRTIHAVLLFPSVSCPTATVYRAFDQGPRAELRADAVRAMSTTRELDPAAPFNDLKCAAMTVAPELAAIFQRAAATADRPAHLSGSGSTLFVLCDDAFHAESLARALEERMNLPAMAVTSV